MAREDAKALPCLIAAMQAASDGDVALAREQLDQALLHCQRSSARVTIELAIVECSASEHAPDLQVIWSRAYIATKQLTFADPPDIMTLPIPPAMRREPCPQCSAAASIDWSFCVICGTQLPSKDQVASQPFDQAADITF